jgi:Cu2+-containing amine oxidase
MLFFSLLKRGSLLVLVALFIALGAAGVARGEPDFTEALKVAKIVAPLTREETAAAVKLAEQSLKSQKLFSERKMYLVEASFTRDSVAETKGIFERLSALTYYRYEGNLTIVVRVNLSRQQVITVKQMPNSYPAFSGDELALATELAFKDPKLKDLLGPYRERLIVDPMTSHNEDANDPLFQHRVIHLLFRTGPTYLVPQWKVLVDLTTEKVIIEPERVDKPM